MDEALLARYWCHMCSQMVNPRMEIEIKCPNCNSGFVEEMEEEEEEAEGSPNAAPAAQASDSDDQALGLWAPIMLGMLNDGLRRRRLRSSNEEETDDNDAASLFRRQQRTAAILEVLNDIQERMRLDSDTNPNPNPSGERRREHRILINPFNQAVIIQGSIDSNPVFNRIRGAALGDYYIGPGIERLLQHLAENDPNRHGTPPARKEAVEAMPKVKVEEKSSCSICLDEFEIGDEAREMPCKHRFHGGCILPWLEMHSSCPVCRFQMPVEGSKDSSSSSGGDGNESNGEGNGENGGNGRRFWMSVPWPFNGLFSSSSSSSQGSSENGNGSSNSSSAQER